MLLINLMSIQVPAQDIPNGDFESWDNNIAGILDPEYWETQNEPGLVFVKNADGHTGLYSASLHVVWDSMMQKFTGASMTATENISAAVRLQSLTGYCKGIPNNSDTLKININLYSANELVGVGSSNIIQTNIDWEQFVVPIIYYSDKMPGKMKISFSVKPVDGNHFQTTYCIDDLSFKGKTK